MSNLSDRLRDLVPHVRGTGLDGKGHVLVREASDALDAMESALLKVRRELHAWAGDDERAEHALKAADEALAKLEGK